MQNQDVEKLLRYQLTNIDVKQELETKLEDQLTSLKEKLGKSTCKLYDSNIYTGTDPSKIYPVMQFVESNEEHEMFDYYKTITASIPLCSNMPGRVLKILVKDRFTQKYLGLIQLSTDLLSNPEKLNYLEIDPVRNSKVINSLRDNGANISICMPLQPFGFNFCGGKLLTMLAFSTDVHEYYRTTFDVQLK